MRIAERLHVALLIFLAMLVGSTIPLATHAKDSTSGPGSLCLVVDELGAGQWLILELEDAILSFDPSLGHPVIVEPCLPNAIRAAQKRGVAVIGVSTRPRSRWGAVQSDLSRYGLDFALSPLPTGRLMNKGWISGRNGVQFDRGIFFAGLADRREFITDLMGDLLFPPKIAVLIERAISGNLEIEPLVVSELVQNSRQSCDTLLR